MFDLSWREVCFYHLFIYSLTLGSLILLQNLIHSRGGGVPRVGPGRISAGLLSRWKCQRENGLERNEKVGSTKLMYPYHNQATTCIEL